MTLHHLQLSKYSNQLPTDSVQEVLIKWWNYRVMPAWLTKGSVDLKKEYDMKQVQITENDKQKGHFF